MNRTNITDRLAEAEKLIGDALVLLSGKPHPDINAKQWRSDAEAWIGSAVPPHSNPEG